MHSAPAVPDIREFIGRGISPREGQSSYGIRGRLGHEEVTVGDIVDASVMNRQDVDPRRWPAEHDPGNMPARG